MTQPEDRPNPPSRLWVRLFVAIQLLLAICLLAAAMTPLSAPATPTTSVEAELSADEDEEEWESEEECEELEELEEEEFSEEVIAEFCEEEGEAEGSSTDAPPECLLRSAQARAVAFPTRNRMRLTIGYTTYAPAAATIEYRAKSSNRLGSASRKLGRSGVIRFTKHLGDAQMERLSTARRFTVVVHVPGAPRNCRSFETKQLSVDHSSRAQITWAQDR